MLRWKEEMSTAIKLIPSENQEEASMSIFAKLKIPRYSISEVSYKEVFIPFKNNAQVFPKLNSMCGFILLTDETSFKHLGRLNLS